MILASDFTIECLTINYFVMSESKVIMFPEMGTCGASNSALDPNLLLALTQNGGMNGGNWMWVLFLFVLFGWRGNGFLGGNNGDGTGFLSNQINNTAGRDLLMQAINTNGTNLSALASNLNCDVNSIKNAINTLQNSICQVSNNLGMSIADVKNSATMGNMNLAQQIAQCCCDNKLLVQGMGYEGQLRDQANTGTIVNRIGELANGVTQGFSATAYETAQQTCSIQNGLRDQTQTILNKLDAIEDSRKDREIADLTAKLTASTSRAERQAELAPIYQKLNDIGCKQPNTVTVPYQPFVTVPNCVAYQAFGGYPFANTGGSIWA